MSKQLIIYVILGIFVIPGPVIAQKGKIKRAKNLIEALDYQAAVDILLPLSEKGDNADVATMLGHIFRKQNSYNKAAIWYEKAVAIEGVDPTTYYYYGMMLLHTNKCRDAQEKFDLFLSYKPLDPRQFQLRDACAFREKLLSPGEDQPEVEALGFNSVLSDIGPAFYKNGLVFGSVRAPRVSAGEAQIDPFYDLYYVEKQNSHFQFSEPQSFSDRINSRVHEAIVTFNADASMIYFTRNQGVDNEHSSATATGLEIVYAETEDGVRWSDLQLLPFHSPKYSIAHPSLSPDGSMLFFSSDMPGGFGGKDIYVSQKEGDFWADPVNLGPLVNTEGDEMYPFYHPSGKLYFSSDGQVGLGGQDIFSTSPNKAKVWDNIQNIGAPINTEFDDYGIIISQDEAYGYFTSNRPGGKGKDDIYGFQKAQAAEEELVTENAIPEGNKVVVHIQVIDASNGQRIENPVIRNCEVNLYRSVGTSSFQMNLPPGECCEVAVSAPGFKESTIEVCGDPNNKSRAIALQKYPAREEETEMVSEASSPAPTPVEETVTETPAEKQIEETVVETPVMETPAEEKIEETVAETPATKTPAEEQIEETVVEEPVIETPTEDIVEETVAETPVIKTPEKEKIEETVVEEPLIETPTEDIVEETVAETPVIKTPEKEQIDETVVEEPQIETPTEDIVEEAVAEVPVIKTPEKEKIDETVVEEPQIETPTEDIVEETVAEVPVIKTPEKEQIDETMVEEPTIETPTEDIVEEAVAKVPVEDKVENPTVGDDLEEAVVRANRTPKSVPEPEPKEQEAEEKSENAVTVSNETPQNPKKIDNAPGVVEETTEIVRQTTRARKTTKYLIGTVYDPLNSRPIPYATIHMLNSTCGVNMRITSDASGHYRLPLVPNCCINIRVEKEGFQTYTALEAICTDKSGSIKGSTSLLLKPEEPKPKPKEVNSESQMLVNRGLFKDFERSKNKRLGDKSLAFVLNVYYETARTSVKEESVEELMKLLKLLEENPALIVEIGAHTDSRGSDDYNKDLSQRRAENVVKYLVSQGIDEKRLIAKGYGESQLINDCDDNKECDESEHQINRRTEFQIIGGLDQTE